MKDAFIWVVTNWEFTLVPAIFIILNAARAIARLTPTEKDDVFINMVEGRLKEILGALTIVATAVKDVKKVVKKGE